MPSDPIPVKPVGHKQDFFSRFATKTARIAGSSGSFSIAVGVLLVWAVTGPLFHFSDTWQLIINTGTTIVTFLMVFLIQNTQNRDSEALHLKVDALIVANKRARNTLIEMEDLSQEELDAIKQWFAEKAHQDAATLSASHLEECLSDPAEHHHRHHRHPQRKPDGNHLPPEDVP
jgi:low affinity Fe/Cu permease